MVQGQDAQHTVAIGEDAVGQGGIGIRHEVFVGERDSFRLPGGSGGEEKMGHRLVPFREGSL